MQVILTNDVVGLGDIGETVTVKPGYARNFLIPRGIAIETQSKNAASVKHKMQGIEAKKKKLKDEALAFGKKLSEVTIEFGLKVGSGGKVFGSIGPKDISEKFGQFGLEIDRKRILFTEHIKKIGEQEVKVKLHPEVIQTITVNVVKIEATSDLERSETESARHRLDQKSKRKAIKEVEEVVEE